jgi:hypothetical protein
MNHTGKESTMINIVYCALCETEAILRTDETTTPLCFTCATAYEWGQASPNQGMQEIACDLAESTERECMLEARLQWKWHKRAEKVKYFVIGLIAMGALAVAIYFWKIPRCAEDQVILGARDFNAGRWTRYQCGPAVDDFVLGP